MEGENQAFYRSAHIIDEGDVKNLLVVVDCQVHQSGEQLGVRSLETAE
jgi:hypothetical protein